MKTYRHIPVLLVALGAGACMMPPRQGAQQPAQQPLVTDEQKEAVRKQEAAAEEAEKAEHAT